MSSTAASPGAAEAHLPGVPRTLRWEGDAGTGALVLIDQRLLPRARQDLRCDTSGEVFEAIRTLAVRGAPAIGGAAAYGLVLGAREALEGEGAYYDRLASKAEHLASSRPTAVNLGWALDRMLGVARAASDEEPPAILARLLDEARTIEEEDAAMCRAIGRHGAALLAPGARVLTHCNAGALATCGIGTALGVIYTAHADKKGIEVFARETRPLLQGARITSFELSEAGVPVTLIADGMAGALMTRRGVDAVVVGADRIARNGDVANKIGTYELAVLAERHGVPFYVAAPSSTFDLAIASGDEIPIEERAPEELRELRGVPTAPESVAVWNPAFDVTPAALVRAIITERGVIAPPSEAAVMAHLA